MQKRYFPITAVVVLLVVVAGAGYLIPEPTPKIPDRILLDNAAGKVVFNHKTHSKDDAIPCKTCHHEMLSDSQDVHSCGTCHGITCNEAFRKNHPTDIQGANACATCHHMTFAKAPAWNHAAHVDDYGLDCTSCHHEDTDIEPEPQNCADCHDTTGDEAMPSLRNAVHAKCQSCHEDMFAAKVNGCSNCHTPVLSRERVAQDGAKSFTVVAPYANCTTCHVDQEATDLIPGRMDAFHGQCITCHEKVGLGPFAKDQCNQCHTK